MRGGSGRVDLDASGLIAAIFPFPAFELLQQTSSSVFSHIFAYQPAGPVDVLIRGRQSRLSANTSLATSSEDFPCLPTAGGKSPLDDDRIGATAVVVISMGCKSATLRQRRQRSRPIDADRQRAFTVIGMTPSELLRRRSGCQSRRVSADARPGAVRSIRREHVPRSELLSGRDDGTSASWRPSRTGPGRSGASEFGQWVATTAINDKQRANLPVLTLEEGAGGLDSLRRRYPKPLYVSCWRWLA